MDGENILDVDFYFFFFFQIINNSNKVYVCFIKYILNEPQISQ